MIKMKTLLILLTILLSPVKSFANPACAVCTVAIGATLAIARKLGIADSIVGLWSGAILALVGYWTILFSTILGFLLFIYSQKFYQYMKKNNGGHAHFPFEKVVLPLAILTILSFYFNYINF